MTAALWKLLFSLSLGVLQEADASLLLRKCCQEGRYLKINNDRNISCDGIFEIKYSYSSETERVSEVLTQEYPNFPWWMDPEVTPLSATTLAPVSRFLSDQDNETYIEYGVQTNISHLLTALVRSTDDGYSLLHNGSLMFQTYNGNNISFPPSSYCADSALFDSGETSFVYIVSPCDYTECISSCCYTDEILKVWWGYAVCRDESTGRSYKLVGDPLPGPDQSSDTVCSYVEPDDALYLLDNVLWNTTYSGHMISLHYTIQPIHPIVLTPYHDCVELIRSKNHEKYKYQFFKCAGELLERIPFFFVVEYCSAAVLVLTLLVFIVTGEANGSKSKIIVSHITCVLIADVCSALLRNRTTDSILTRLLAELYLPYFSTAGTLWINVLCLDLAASFRSFWVSNSGRRSTNTRWFLYYNIYVWGVTAVTSILTDIFTSDGVEEEYISFFHIPFICGIVNFFLLSYTVIQLIRRQRQGRGPDVENSARHSAVSCFSKHRRLLVHINLLLLMGPPSACSALLYHLMGPTLSVINLIDCMKLLRAFSILLFVLLKPRIWILLRNKTKIFFNLFTRKEAPISSGPRTATTAL